MWTLLGILLAIAVVAASVAPWLWHRREMRDDHDETILRALRRSRGEEAD